MDFASVRTAADEVLAATADTGVDVLLCNAGVMALSVKLLLSIRPVGLRSQKGSPGCGVGLASSWTASVFI